MQKEMDDNTEPVESTAATAPQTEAEKALDLHSSRDPLALVLVPNEDSPEGGIEVEAKKHGHLLHHLHKHHHLPVLNDINQSPSDASFILVLPTADNGFTQPVFVAVQAPVEKSASTAPRSYRGPKVLPYLTGAELLFAVIVTVASTSRAREDMDSSGSHPTPVQVKSFDPALSRPKRVVHPGDDLERMAEEIYRNRALAWLIITLNKDLKPSFVEGRFVVKLRAGQIIDLPVTSDLRVFAARRRPDGQIVTIVQDGRAKGALLNNKLGGMLGLENNRDPLST